MKNKLKINKFESCFSTSAFKNLKTTFSCFSFQSGTWSVFVGLKIWCCYFSFWYTVFLLFFYYLHQTPRNKSFPRPSFCQERVKVRHVRLTKAVAFIMSFYTFFFFPLVITEWWVTYKWISQMFFEVIFVCRSLLLSLLKLLEVISSHYLSVKIMGNGALGFEPFCMLEYCVKYWRERPSCIN